METPMPTQAKWERALNGRLSALRMGGFALDRLWLLMMFYSIVPYLRAGDVRGSLYSSLFLSLVTMAATLLLVGCLVKGRDRLSARRALVIAAMALMAAGTALTMLADFQTTNGMLMLGVSSLMTGSSSAVLFIAWLERFADAGGRVAMVELSLSYCVAFLAAFLVALIPGQLSMLVVVAAPVASGLLLLREEGQAHAREAALRQGIAQGQVDAGQAAARACPVLRELRRVPLSKQTVCLFAKALAGALALGVLEGFFDVLSGYRTYVVQDLYGFCLLLGGFACMLILCLIAVFLHRDGIFYAYRFSLLCICIGCLLAPFMHDNNTYSSAVIFGGYACFAVTLAVVCINVSDSFSIGLARTFGSGFFALYLGEVLGSAAAHGIGAAALTVPELTTVTLLAVSLLFVAHLFLFTETDLVRIGIGEVGQSLIAPAGQVGAAPAQQDAAAAAAPEPVDPCARIIERYGLTPRESDVLPLLLQGRTISRICETLYISAGTVSTHIRHIYQKTDCDNRQELIDLAQEISDELEARG